MTSAEQPMQKLLGKKLNQDDKVAPNLPRTKRELQKEEMKHMLSYAESREVHA